MAHRDKGRRKIKTYEVIGILFVPLVSLHGRKIPTECAGKLGQDVRSSQEWEETPLLHNKCSELQTVLLQKRRTTSYL